MQILGSRQEAKEEVRKRRRGETEEIGNMGQSKKPNEDTEENK